MNGSNPTSNPGEGGADIPDLSRVLFFDGQRLEAGDLNGAATVQRELRWLHNRSLHSWGIGLGFAVTGNKGDKQVQIGPGYAIDCRGREIILTEAISKSVPARAGDSDGKPLVFYLVAAYPDDAALKVLERRDGECGTGGATRMQERAAIYWKEGDRQVQTGMEIVLAQARVLNCQLDAPLSVQQRRTARPSQQPYVGVGQIDGRDAAWGPWEVIIAGKLRVLGVKLAVNTSAARFSSVPQYQAQLQGERLVLNSGVGDFSTFVLDGTLFTREATRTGFNVYVHMPSGVTIGRLPVNPPVLFDNPKFLLGLVAIHWSLSWAGVEGLEG